MHALKFSYAQIGKPGSALGDDHGVEGFMFNVLIFGYALIVPIGFKGNLGIFQSNDIVKC